jgi:dTDP-4-dehydrorhamnose 3,5-epimerase
MELINTPIQGVFVLKPNLFKDDRGYFYESYNQKTFEKLGITDHFVQDNQSCSQKDVVRGLHFQKPPFAQAKLVRVIQGAILDIAVDLRKHSITYGKYYAAELTAENHLQLYIPVGFAHGFVVLEDNTIVQYKCSEFYNKEYEGTIIYNDPILNIDWNVKNPILAAKDMQGLDFNTFISPF